MIKWEDKYSVSISMIDEEHKKIIDIINNAIYTQQHNRQEDISGILTEMTVYALEHFKTEETYMTNFKYNDYKSHKDEHINFSNMISNYTKRLMDGEYKIIDEILEYLKQWLFNHIQGTDKKFVTCFKKNDLI